MKIIIDIGGCDHPEKMVKGAALSAADHPDHEIVVVGDAEFIGKNAGKPSANFTVVHASDVITNDDSPTRAIRQKPDSSLVKSINILNSDDTAIGLVSAGSTGAVLTASTLLIGRLNGVHRPVLASLMPTAVDGKLVCIADCGANVNSNPEFVAQFALMGSLYMSAIFDIEKPVVGLLSVGTEDKKGNELTKAAFPLLEAMPINFAGNMEARDTLTGKYDVIACDGFSGNVLTKATEGAAKMVMTKLKESIMSSLSAKIGALFMKKALNDLKSAMNYHSYGGAAFLGIKKLVVKSHGSTNEISTRASVNNILRMHEHDIISSIEKGVATDTQA